jgi:hypothetical protein
MFKRQYVLRAQMMAPKRAALMIMGLNKELVSLKVEK